MDIVKISPEVREVVNTYLETMDIAQTANILDMDKETVSAYLKKKEVKAFIDNVFLETGYNNRFKIAAVMERVIEQKLRDMEESELGSNKDILDILALQHKMRMDELNLLLKHQELQNKESVNNNIQINNYGSNYAALMEKILGS
jgi:predicted transcriptional regulator